MLLAVARLATTQNRAAGAGARAAGVNATAWAILCEVSLDGWLTNGQIAERLGMSTGGVTPALDRLERSGLLERSPNPADRRSSIVALTPAGREELARTTDALARALEPVLARMQESERETALRFLVEVNDALLDVRDQLGPD